VEMQLAEQREFLKRATFCSAGVYRNQLQRGEYFDKLRAVYMIAILDFTIFEGLEPVSWHATCDLVTKNPSIGNIYTSVVELPKFTKSLDQVNSFLDEWIYLMKHIQEWDDFPASFGRPPLVEAGEILWEGALNPAEHRIYEQMEPLKRWGLIWNF
jgi:predicted transposase/invertase (TIGR01784 family)